MTKYNEGDKLKLRSKTDETVIYFTYGLESDDWIYGDWVGAHDSECKWLSILDWDIEVIRPPLEHKLGRIVLISGRYYVSTKNNNGKYKLWVSVTGASHHQQIEPDVDYEIIFDGIEEA